MAKASLITEEELKAGDKKPKPVRDIDSGEIIKGKVYPGPRAFKTHNEAVNPDGC